MSKQGGNSEGTSGWEFLIFPIGLSVLAFWLLGEQAMPFFRELIADPQTALASSRGKFDNDFAIIGIIPICFWVGFVSVMLGVWARRIVKKIDRAKHPVAIGVAVCVLSIVPIAAGIMLFMLLMPRVDVLGEMIFPVKDDLAWSGGERVSFSWQRWTGLTLMFLMIVGIVIGTAAPALIALKDLIRHRKR